MKIIQLKDKTTHEDLYPVSLISDISVADYIELGWDLATPYSSLSTYEVGILVTYNSHLYECKTAITSPESWNSAHWTLLE